MRRRAPAVLVLLLLASCEPSRRRAFAAAMPRAAAPAPVPPADDPFLRGREILSPWLEPLAADATARDEPVVAFRLPDAEATLLADARGEGRRDVRSAFVHGVAYRVAATPARAAAVLCDPAAEKASFGADEGADLGPAALGEGRRMSFGLVDFGERPFRYDYRWALEARRETRPGGRVLVRYDLLADPAPERVSLLAGVAWVEPDGDGARVVEVLALGSPVTPPFFLAGKARSEVARLLTQRANRLAARMR